MSYVECPQCGHKALSVATRCPSCGHDMPPQRLRYPEPKRELARLRPTLLIAVVALAGIVIVLVTRHGTGTKVAGERPAAARADTLPAPELRPSPQQPAAVTDSSPQAAPPRSPPPPVVPLPTDQAVRRYARTWVNVRAGRNRDTPPVRVLNPGEAVRVDSLRRGWYRVLVDGRTLGYVHRLQLDVVPPPTSP